MKVLVVANQTLGGRKIFERIEWYTESDHNVEVYVVVPATGAENQPSGATSGDRDGRELAQERLDAALSTIRALNVVSADGEVGDPDPLTAVRDVLTRFTPGRIALATLPEGRSRWLRLDLPSRIGRMSDAILDHVEADPESTSIEGEAVTQWEPIDLDGSGGRLDLLLVEDNAADVELTRIALERSSIDCDIRTAHNGQRALREMAERRPDLVLMDISMPIMDGHETLQAMRDDVDLRDVPVIVMTTSTRDDDRDRAHELGARAHIIKDNDFNRFQEVLDGVLSQAVKGR